MKTKKYIALGLLSVVLFSTVVPTALAVESVAKNESETMLRAWPGRPGGNGDGSEEWLQGSYGQTNGPYKWIGASQGLTEDLNNRTKIADSFGIGVLNGLITYVFPGATVAKLMGCGINVYSIVGSISGTYKGAYYKANTYVSGRRMKTVITTYKNSDYTGYVKTYTKYYKF